MYGVFNQQSHKKNKLNREHKINANSKWYLKEDWSRDISTKFTLNPFIPSLLDLSIAMETYQNNQPAKKLEFSIPMQQFYQIRLRSTQWFWSLVMLNKLRCQAHF